MNAEPLRVTKKLLPHQPGALKLARRYGDALLWVRYRRNEAGTRRYTTVEIAVESRPAATRERTTAGAGRSKIVGVRIGFNEEGTADACACPRRHLGHEHRACDA